VRRLRTARPCVDRSAFAGFLFPPEAPAQALEQLRAAGCTLAVVATGGDPGHAPAGGLYEAAGFTAPAGRSYRTITTPENRPTDPAD